MRPFSKTRAWQNWKPVLFTDTSTARLEKSLPEETFGVKEEMTFVRTIRICIYMYKIIHGHLVVTQ